MSQAFRKLVACDKVVPCKSALRNQCTAQTHHAKRNAVFKSGLGKPDIVAGLFMIILVLTVKKRIRDSPAKSMRYKSSCRKSRGLPTPKGSYKILDSYLRQILEIQIFRLCIKSSSVLQTCSVFRWIVRNI